jgi:hypothetical protein
MKCKANVTANKDGASKGVPTRQSKNVSLIEKSESEECAKLAGAIDALAEIVAEESTKVEPPPPYENNAKYYLLSPFSVVRPRFVEANCFFSTMGYLLVFCYSVVYTMHFCVPQNRVIDENFAEVIKLILYSVAFGYVQRRIMVYQNYVPNFIEFILYASDERSMPDMRPDYMSHTKLKHGTVRGSVRVVRSLSCHIKGHSEDTTPVGLVNWFFFYLAVAIYGNVTLTEDFLPIDMEVFNQIKSSIVMTPSKTSTDRIDNSISRLSSVNLNRRSNDPIYSNTCIFLKAYHWHHVAIKESVGYFSPYELSPTTRF